MDDDPVLRELGADLEREDPALAALLTGAAPPDAVPPDAVPPRRRHRARWVLLGLTVLAFALVAAPTVTLGVLAMLLVLASPLVACWWCALPGDGPTARHP